MRSCLVGEDRPDGLYLSSSVKRFFNLSLVLPLFLSWLVLCSWQASSTSPPSPPPSPISIASQTLRNNGYSFFASAIDAALSDHQTNQWNGTGTIFAPPDFAFSFTTAKFKNGRSSSPRPTFSLLNFHTLRQPMKLNHLAVRSEGDAFLTFSPKKCMFKCKNLAGELCVAGKRRHLGDYVRIRYPDLFVSEDLVVHGVDGVLDPSDATKCTDYADSFDPTAVVSSSPSPSSAPAAGDLSSYIFLDHAVRTLKRRGYGIVATAMAIKRSDLKDLTGITVFAPRDDNLFNLPDGFRYDFRSHVVPRQIRLTDLVRLKQGTEIDTLVPGATIVVNFNDGGVLTVNDVPIDKLEIYHNGWVVILSVPRPLHTSRSPDVPVGAPSVINRRDPSPELGLRNLSPSNSVHPINEKAPSPDSGVHDDTKKSPTTFSEFDEDDLTQTPPPSILVSVPTEIRCPSVGSPTVNDGGGISALSVGLQSYCSRTPEGSPSADVASSDQ